MPKFKAQSWTKQQPIPQPAPIEGSLLTQKQACQLLGVSGRTIYTITKSGRLPVVRLNEGGTPKYRRVDLDAFIESCISGGAPADAEGGSRDN